MNDGGDQRRLSAILAADVVGYTRLMEQDTDGTVAAWKSARASIIDPAISNHAGRIVKHTGDGFLAEFSTVLDAVKCAVAMQELLATSPLNFRMGVNLGDIIDDGEDIHGEGVNIAARIEAIADPGCICISGSVFDAVRNRIDVPFEDMGEHTVKHVSAPVKVYRVVLDEGPTEKVISELALPDKPSIAVIPFTNLSGDADQEYFCDGITVEITTQLCCFRGLFVISPKSTFQFKDAAMSVQKAGHDLGVAYVLNGNIQKTSNRVRVSAQLTDAATGIHLWAERYDRELDDIFAVQDDVTSCIVATLALQIEELSQQRATQKHTGNLAAFDCFLRGEHHLSQGSMEDLIEARKLFERAIELDPRNAQFCAGLALSYLNESVSGWTKSPQAAGERSFELAKKAVALDERDSRSHFVLAEAHLFSRRDFDCALIEIEKAVELNPNDYSNICFMSWLHALDGRTTEGITCAITASRLSPLTPYNCKIGHFLACFAAGTYDDAIAALQNISPMKGIALACLAACFAKVGRSAEANAAMATFVEESKSELLNYPGEDNVAWREYWATCFPFRDATVFDDLMVGMREAGLPT